MWSATVSDVARSIRAVASTDVVAELADLLAYASAEVVRIAPLAPDVVHNRAAVSIVRYIYDKPTSGLMTIYSASNSIRNSGAGRHVAALPEYTGAGVRRRLKQ